MKKSALPKRPNQRPQRVVGEAVPRPASFPYFHVVFTLPHDLSAIALQNKKAVYGLLFRASAETMLEIAADQKHLGADIGFRSVLHTWGQNLQHHPHVHCVIPAGGLAQQNSSAMAPVIKRCSSTGSGNSGAIVNQCILGIARTAAAKWS